MKAMMDSSGNVAARMLLITIGLAVMSAVYSWHEPVGWILWTLRVGTVLFLLAGIACAVIECGDWPEDPYDNEDMR